MIDDNPIKTNDLQEYLSHRQYTRPSASYMVQHESIKASSLQHKPAFQIRHLSRIDFAHKIQSIREAQDPQKQHNQYALKITSSNYDRNTSRKNISHQSQNRRLDQCTFTLDVDDEFTNFVGVRKKKGINSSFKSPYQHHYYSHKKHKICKMISKLMNKDKITVNKCSLLKNRDAIVQNEIPKANTMSIKLDKVDIKVKHFFNIAKLSPWVENE